MASARQLVFDILANDKTAGPLRDVEDRFTNAGKIATGVATGIAAAWGALQVGDFFKDAIAEARESAQVSRLTENALRATGAAAWISADQIGDMSQALSNKIGVDDEAIQSSANLLLTFKNVRNEAGQGANVFDRATAAAQDLAAAGFGTSESASIMLGKALNDPIAGLTALGRAGVTFTEDQKKQIEVMTEAGDLLGAQKIVLGEIESQVGGAAAAAADPMQKLGVVVGNLKENLGTALLPVIDSVATFFSGKLIPAVGGVWDILSKGDFTASFGEALGVAEDSALVDWLFRLRDGAIEVGDVFTGTVVPGFVSVVGWVKENSAWLAPLVLVLGSAVAGYTAYVKVMAAWRTAVAIATAVQLAWYTAMATNPIGLIIAGVVALVAGIIWAYNNVDWFKNGVDAAFAWIKNAIAAVADWWTGTVVPAWNAGYDAVAGVVQTVSNAISAAWEWIRSAAESAWTFIDTWVLLPWKLGFAVAQRVFEIAAQAIGAAWEWIRSAAGAAWSWIQTNVFPPFEFAIASIRGVFEVYGQVAATVWEAIRSAIGTAWEWVRDNVFPPFELAIRAIQTTFEQVSAAIGTAWEKIREAAAAPVRFVVNTVYNDGIRKVVQNVLDALGVNFTLPTAQLSFAQGGVMPGYTPGTDVHHFWSPTAGALSLSGGEGIIRPDALRALGGAPWLDLMNRTRGKGLRFADGGVFGGSGAGTGGITEFWEWITSPARAIASLVTAPADALLAQITGTPWGKALAAMPRKIIGGLIDKVTSLLAPLAASSGGGAEYGGAVGGWVRPSAGRVTSEYGARGTGFHAGIDVAAGAGAPTFAATNGSVYAQGWNVLAGRTGIGIILSHGGGTFTYYGHNPVGGVAVANGQVVATGQRVGAQGSTGNVTGPHLHFELHRGGLGRTVNPRVLGVFDEGGILGPGGAGLNLTSKPERVLAPSNTASFDRLVDLLDGSEVNPRRSLANEVAEALSGARLRIDGGRGLLDDLTGEIVLAMQRRAGRS